MEQWKKSSGRNIAFIGCSARKNSVPCCAMHMYKGTLFKKSLAYCKEKKYKIYILSAQYGLLNLEHVISPYEKTLNTMTKQEIKDWSIKVLRQMKAEGICDQDHLIFFTGEKYHRHFAGEKPLAGLSIGKMLSWFNAHKIKKGLLI